MRQPQTMIYVCGVTGGLVTGQSQTTLKILELLNCRYKGDVKQIEQPYRFSLLLFTIYYFKIFINFFSLRKKIIYLSASRSVKNFYARDLIIFLSVLIFRHSCIVHLVGNDLEKLFKASRFSLFIYKTIFRLNNNAIIVLSKRMRLLVSELLDLDVKDLNSHILPGFIDMKIDYNKITHVDKNNEITIGFMSNLIREKGIFDFLDSIVMFKNKNPGLRLRFWVAGVKQPGVDYSQLDEMFLNKTIEYYDFVAGEEKSTLLYATDIFVLPSYYTTEALPLSLVQAAAHGAALISCSTGDIKDISDISNGRLVRPKDPSAICAAYDDFINGTEFDAVATSKTVCSHFSVETYARKINDIFDALRV